MVPEGGRGPKAGKSLSASQQRGLQETCSTEFNQHKRSAKPLGMRPLIDEDLGSRMLYHMAACTIDCSRRHVADGPFVAVSGSVAHMRDAWICWMWGIVILALQSFRFHTQYTRYVRVRHTHVTTLSGRSCLCQRKGGVCTTSASGGAEAEWRGATRGALLRADSSRALCP